MKHYLMKHCLRIGLAAVIALSLLMASELLKPEAAFALIRQPKVKVNSASVRVDARIHPLNSGIEKAEEVVGEINGQFSPGDSATAQFANSSLSLLETQLSTTGAGSAALSVTQTGPESFRVEGGSIVNNINLLNGAVTADRGETRLICSVASGNVNCPVQSVVFQNLKVNGMPMPNQPQPNTEIEFNRQLTVGGLLVEATVKVVVGATSFRRHGNKTEVILRGLETEARGSILVGLMRRSGDEMARGQVTGMFERLLPGVTHRSLVSDRVTPFHLSLLEDHRPGRKQLVIPGGQKSTPGSSWSVGAPSSKAFRLRSSQTEFQQSGHKIGIALELEA